MDWGYDESLMALPWPTVLNKEELLDKAFARAKKAADRADDKVIESLE